MSLADIAPNTPDADVKLPACICAAVSAPVVIKSLTFEFEILENLNHDKYKFNFITCEHMYTNKREKIYNLLKSKGYKSCLLYTSPSPRDS